METTLDINDEAQTVRPADAARPRYRLPDLSVGDPGSRDPLEAHSWQDMRELIYGGTPGSSVGRSPRANPRAPSA